MHAYPHDRDAFTQGLEYADGILYEGTGRNGHSSVRKVALETGKVLAKRDVAEQHFGEGITLWKSELLELTWQSQVGFVYDRTTLVPKRQWTYKGEGGGLTHDAANIYMSDGSDQIRMLDPATLQERKRIAVRAVGMPLTKINELEFLKGEILANVWMTDYVARISPSTGVVSGYIDLRGLLTPAERDAADVLNGIAYDAAADRLFVTGKLWPKLFEIKIRPPSP